MTRFLSANLTAEICVSGSGRKSENCAATVFTSVRGLRYCIGLLVGWFHVNRITPEVVKQFYQELFVRVCFRTGNNSVDLESNLEPAGGRVEKHET